MEKHPSESAAEWRARIAILLLDEGWGHDAAAAWRDYLELAPTGKYVVTHWFRVLQLLKSEIEASFEGYTKPSPVHAPEHNRRDVYRLASKSRGDVDRDDLLFLLIKVFPGHVGRFEDLCFYMPPILTWFLEGRFDPVGGEFFLFPRILDWRPNWSQRQRQCITTVALTVWAKRVRGREPGLVEVLSFLARWRSDISPLLADLFGSEDDDVRASLIKIMDELVDPREFKAGDLQEAFEVFGHVVPEANGRLLNHYFSADRMLQYLRQVAPQLGPEAGEQARTIQSRISKASGS